MLDNLGFDPLPYYREAPQPTAAFPLTLFMGVRDDGYFQTGHRHVKELRKLNPEPKLFVNAATAVQYDLHAGDWARVETRDGAMKAIVEVRPDMSDGLIRVPHGWWKPETEQGKSLLSGAWLYSDAMITIDDEDYLDSEQGVPHLKGIPCRVSTLSTKASAQDLKDQQQAATTEAPISLADVG